MHDLIDLLLAQDSLSPKDLPRVREACVAIFDNRKKQAWPPQLIVYGSWGQTFTRLAGKKASR